MIPYPEISPEIVRVGPLAIRWYGMMYLLGFASSYFLVRFQIKDSRDQQKALTRKTEHASRKHGSGSQNKKDEVFLSNEMVDSLYSNMILGLLIGARLGYVVFYNLAYYFNHPIEIFAVWHGGMSFHGGFIGSATAGLLFCRKYRLDFWRVADFVAVTAPIGLGLGRLGNFINGELYGRTTDVWWGMVFPDGGPLPRHPSQLYEFFLEGVVLFSVLWALRNRWSRSGIVTSMFIIMYGLFRFFIEFFREPDPQLGFIIGPFTMGQQLSFMMAAAGAIVLYIRVKR